MAGFLRIFQEERRAARGHGNMTAGVLQESSFSREVYLKNIAIKMLQRAPLTERDRAIQRLSKTEATFHKSTDSRASSNPPPPGSCMKAGGGSQRRSLLMAETSRFATEGRPSFSQVGSASCPTNTTQENPKRARWSPRLFTSCPQAVSLGRVLTNRP